MAFLDELRAVREGVGFGVAEHGAMLRVDGPGAAAMLDALATRPPPRRDGTATPALLLRPDARLYADLLVLADDGGFILLVEGPPPAEALAYLRAHAPAGVVVRDLRETHDLLALDGPFAWEPMAELAGKGVLGVPPQTSFRLDPHPGLGLRASRTGEHGYLLLAPRDARDLRARLDALREQFGDVRPGLAALDLCALENGSLSVRTPGCSELTPLELQLQWRVRHGRGFVGSEALLAHHARARVTWFRGAPGGPVPADGAALHIAGAPAGHVLHASDSPLLGRPIGVALLDLRWAHPGLPCTIDGPDGAAIAARTVAPPLVDNRSMHVRAHQHRHARRDQYDFPPLAASRT